MIRTFFDRVSGHWTIALLAFFCVAAPFATATESDADKALSRAQEYDKKEKYSKSAESWLAVELYSDDPMRKANALQNAARAYRQTGMYGKELDCLLRLTNEHINRIDYNKVVSRIYQIGDSFFDGHEDMWVSWLPFIHEKNRKEDAYTEALRLAPCAPEAPDARLRLAIIRMEDNRPQMAIDDFETIMKLYPGTKAARHAYIELASLYCQLASIADGDGRWARRAAAQLDKLIRDYPNDPEIPWAKRERAKIDTMQAKRLHGMAQYYHRTGQDNVAQRYLTRVIRDYGATEDSIDSEKMLAKIDKTYVPPDEKATRKPKPKMNFQRSTIPLEQSDIILVPENSDGRFLFPLRDLEMNRVRDSRDAVPERPMTDDDI